MPEAAKKPTSRAAARTQGDKLEAERQERINERDREKTIWELLAAPFPPDQVEKLPRNIRSGDQDKGKCVAGSSGAIYSADGHYCGGWHARAMHLDYVGHAGVTMRLNEVLTPAGWDWEPVAALPDGLPNVGREFWIKLRVFDPTTEEWVAKLGVGDDFGGSAKQAIGDALRNAAMRFGVATYLWSKSEAAMALKRAEEPQEESPRQQAQEPRQELETPPHVQQTMDMVRSLQEPAKGRLKQWWATAAEGGHMPLLENMQAVTPQQAAMVEDAIANILEAMAQEAPPDPQ